MPPYACIGGPIPPAIPARLFDLPARISAEFICSGRRPEQLDVPAEGKAEGVGEVRSELRRIARPNCAPNCAAAAHREPSVRRSLTIAASAASSVPNSTKASPFGRPLGPSTMWTPAAPIGSSKPPKNWTTISGVALNGRPRSLHTPRAPTGAPPPPCMS